VEPVSVGSRRSEKNLREPAEVFHLTGSETMIDHKDIRGAWNRNNIVPRNGLGPVDYPNNGEVNMKTNLTVKMIVLVAVGVVGLAGSANAAIIDIRIDSVTGVGASFTDKTASIPELGTVTFGVWVDLTGTAGAVNGLGSMGVSLRSFTERYNVPTSPTVWPTPGPTATDTVLNATDRANLMPTAFSELGYSTGTLADITATMGNPDPADTDIDLKDLGGGQTSTNGWQIGYAITATRVATVTFTAQDLAELTRPLNRDVHVNTFYTTASGSNSGAAVRALTGIDPVTNSINATNLMSAAQIGTDAVVTVISGDNAPMADAGGPYGSADWSGPAGWMNPLRHVDLHGSGTDDHPPLASWKWEIDLDRTGGTNWQEILVGSGDPPLTQLLTIQQLMAVGLPALTWDPDHEVNTFDVKFTVTDTAGHSVSDAGRLYVPEPGTMALLALGGLGVLLRRRKNA
jgi:hypothetical protein